MKLHLWTVKQRTVPWNAGLITPLQNIIVLLVADSQSAFTEAMIVITRATVTKTITMNLALLAIVRIAT